MIQKFFSEKNIVLCAISAMLLCPLTTFGQELNGYVNPISSVLKIVEASKLEYTQELNLSAVNYVDYVVVSLGSKGKTNKTIYNFSFADVDINTVRALTKKDIIIVQLLVKGKQKLIKKSSNNGEKTSYVDKVSFFAKNIDNARDIVAAIKNIIPINETVENNKLVLNTYKDYQNWLQNNISDVDYIKTQLVQKIEADKYSNGHLKLTTTINSKSKTTINEYEFNLATLNPSSIVFKISSDQFYIEATNRRNIKAIKVFKNGVQQSFTNKVRFYSGSIENGKDIYKVLKQIIPLAEKTFLDSKPNTSSVSDAYKCLNDIIKNVSTNDDTISQSMQGDCIANVLVKETNPKETTDKEYKFNFTDINLDNIDYDSNKNQLYVEINTRKKANFIHYVKNNELQNYTSKFRLYVNSIEDAMISKEALQNIAKKCERGGVNVDYSTVLSGIEALKKEIALVKIGDNSYDQSLEVVNTSPYVVKITSVFSNLKNSKEAIYEFGLEDINFKNIAIVTSGKKVMVELNTRHLEKIIKSYQDGSIKSYVYKVTIQATDVENARRIVALFKNVIKDL